MPSHGLTDKQLGIVRNTFIPYADKIECVGLFGSRATGKARASSDIDIVVYGKITEADIDRLRTLFDESELAIKVDITAYHQITYPHLKTHIDEVMQVLFTHDDLERS